MKTLIVYYSRTGTTKKISESLANKIGADLEEIRDTVNRSGIIGYMRSGRDAMKRYLTKLEKTEKDPAEYDLVVIGTPIWGWNLSSPTRTYISENKEKFKKVAFFCTMGGSGFEKAFSEMEEIIGKKPLSVLSFKTVEVVGNNFSEKVDIFLKELGF